MKKPHLDFYFKCIESGRLPDDNDGLCLCAIDEDLFDLFEPNTEDSAQLNAECLSVVYWASGVSIDDSTSKYGGFTSLRQTIVLFMAAINNEL